VALGGLLCYGTICGLGLFAGSRVFNTNRWLATTLATAALLAALTGLWFTALQIFTLGSFCYYCLGIHFCGLAIAGLVLWSALRQRPHQVAASRSHVAIVATIPGARRPVGPRLAEGPSLLAAGPIAGVLLALLIVVQVMFPAKMFEATKPELADTIDMTAAAESIAAESDRLSPTAQPHVVNRLTDDDSATGDEPATSDAEPVASRDGNGDGTEQTAATEEEPADKAPELSREVTYLKGKVRLDAYQEAILGSPDAKYVVVELMDYTCPHCRKMHAHILEAIERYGDQLAVVILPMPLELECNKLVPATDPLHRGACKISRTALAVAEIDPGKFVDFHYFLLAEEERSPTAAQAVVRAFRLVDRKELSRLGHSKEIEDRIQKNIRLYSALSAQHRGEKSFGLPVQIFGDTVLTGGEITSEEMFEAWEKALGIKPL
jgi:hypothetical protein